MNKECAICLSLGDICLTCEEAEFAVWADRHFASADYRQTTAGVYVQDWMRHSFSAWQARGTYVARLQAEVSALQQRLNIADQRVCDQHAKLTKAQSLSPVNWTDRQVLDFLGVALRNVDLVGEVRLSEIRKGFQFMQERQSATPIAHNVDESCGKDAEAAKGGA
ncbi:hypothetical protein [Pseudomonas sp. PS02290]|uniref:hypothetical protein n=1 Tax=Pseudomonas sp. PS02290 TaxID=2991430 RepID=UPI00249BF2B6|nr:hypothetical protein [Pseudomonas sp. PS02290]